MKRIPITEEQFKVFFGNPDWHITEVPQSQIEHIIDLPRKSDVVAVYSSGDLTQPKILNGVSAVLGMDVVAQETNPNTGKCEPELNIYHVVVQKFEKPIQNFGYLMHVAYTGETLFGHWKTADVLDDYINVKQAKFGEFFLNSGIAPLSQNTSKNA